MERLKRWRGLSRLRRQTRRAPSPAAYGELAERLIALGEVEPALRIAEEGLELFPDSERLAHVRLFAKKGRLAGEIRRLRDDLQRRPNPATYVRLAGLYRELGSHDEALAIAAECAERFPLNEAPYLVQGEIRVERFRRDLIAKDGVIAEAALTKVVRLNSHNVAAHVRLAELYWLVGMTGACRRHARHVASVAPPSRALQDFLRDLDGTPVESEETESFAELIETVERNGVFANDPAAFPDPDARVAADRSRPRGRVDESRSREQMAAFGDHAGVRNAVLLDRDGAVIADFTIDGSLSKGQFAELVCGIRDVADEASRRMDTGALVRADVEGPGGNVVLARARGLTIALLYRDPLRGDRAWEIVQDFVARNLAVGREEAHA
jgi:tetratricopeptide (TPR) repeat protein